MITENRVYSITWGFDIQKSWVHIVHIDFSFILQLKPQLKNELPDDCLNASVYTKKCHRAQSKLNIVWGWLLKSF